MHFPTIFSAVVLLSNTVLAHPQLVPDRLHPNIERRIRISRTHHVHHTINHHPVAVVPQGADLTGAAASSSALSSAVLSTAQAAITTVEVFITHDFTTAMPTGAAASTSEENAFWSSLEAAMTDGEAVPTSTQDVVLPASTSSAASSSETLMSSGAASSGFAASSSSGEPAASSTVLGAPASESTTLSPTQPSFTFTTEDIIFSTTELSLPSSTTTEGPIAAATSSSLSCPLSFWTQTITTTETITQTTYISSLSPIINSTSSSSSTSSQSDSVSSSSSSSSSSISFSTSEASVHISASPVTIASTISFPATTVAVTTTVTSGVASGTPIAGQAHCGVHGFPNGDYFMGSYDMDDKINAVTLLGCYEFCLADNQISNSCQSYEFYPEPGTGAPRCNLYSANVAGSLYSIIPGVENVWSDLGCGAPA